MGGILNRFRRKPSTRETLEKLQAELDYIDEFKRSTQEHHKKVIGYLLTYFGVLYLVSAIIAYFKFFLNSHWQDWRSQLQLMIPFIIAPLVIIVVKQLLTWWYHRKIRLNEVKFEKLKKEKSSILERVMETETYKVAKEILEKFGSEHQLPKVSATTVSSPGPNTSDRFGVANRPVQPNVELRRRHTAAPAPIPASPANVSRIQPVRQNTSVADTSVLDSTMSMGDMNSSMQRPLPGAQGPMNRRPPGPPLPRPVLPRERGYMDKVVEYLVGDGPSNRYALICRQCQSHNGMALKEEFEYIAYRCCYCYYWNPARKQRPVAPKLSANPQASQSSTESEDDSEDSQSAKSQPVDSESKPEVTTLGETEIAEDDDTPMETSEISEEKK